MGRGIYVETRIRAPMDLLWHATQDPAAHASWDLRFSSIAHLPTPADEPQRFRYDNRTVPFAPMTGVGISLGERHRPDGSCTSALRFAADSRLSPIASGDGYWRYVPDGERVRFFTGYDYEPGWQGRRLDSALVRPVIGWMTAWSFDRLRLWLDHGVDPTVALRRTVAVWVTKVALSGAAVAAVPLASVPLVVAGPLALVVLLVPSPVQVPRARRCLRRPRAGTRPTPPGIAREVDASALDRALGPAAQHTSQPSDAHRGAPRMTTSVFAQALGSDVERLHPQMRRRFGLTPDGENACVGRGVMDSVWRGPLATVPFLWFGAWRNILVPRTGRDIPFTIENYCYVDGLGRDTTTFVRTFEFPRQRRSRFDATMVYDPRAGRVLDYLGTHQHLAVDLDLSVDDRGGLLLRSGAQRFYEGPVGFSFPMVASGTAELREHYDDTAGRFRIDLTVSNPLVGPVFGYRGSFTCDFSTLPATSVPASAKPLREEARW